MNIELARRSLACCWASHRGRDDDAAMAALSTETLRVVERQFFYGRYLSHSHASATYIFRIRKRGPKEKQQNHSNSERYYTTTP